MKVRPTVDVLLGHARFHLPVVLVARLLDIFLGKSDALELGARQR